MKNLIIITITFTIVFILSGCDQMVYKVSIDEEAVITQDGRVVGDSKKPGIHFKVPYLHKIHFVKTVRIRRNEFSVKGYENTSLLIFWKIDNTITYFKSNQRLNLESNFENLVSNHVSKFIDSNVEIKHKIINRKHKVMQSNIFLDDLRNLTESYGIKLIDAFILIESNLAQHHNAPD